MKKKFLFGVFILVLLLCAPVSRMNLTSDAEPSVSDTAEDTPAVLVDGTSPAAPEPLPDTVITNGEYNLSLTSSIGTLTYYNQSDIRWANHLYGGTDPMAAYGCGPTVMAMLVTSFTSETYLPSDMADWAAANNYWASGSGTKHSFIPECAAAFGFEANSFQNFTVEGVISELKNGHILVALMGPGHFTDSGHFIIISDYWSGTQVRVADPAHLDVTEQAWDIQLILNELSSSNDHGAPVWSIAPK